jgi:hypothetical protein
MHVLHAETTYAIAGRGKRTSGTLEATATERDDANSDTAIDNKIEIPRAAGTSRCKQTWLEIGRFSVHDLTQTI